MLPRGASERQMTGERPRFWPPPDHLRFASGFLF
jgi:hypothetical protein